MYLAGFLLSISPRFNFTHGIHVIMEHVVTFCPGHIIVSSLQRCKCITIQHTFSYMYVHVLYFRTSKNSSFISVSVSDHLPDFLRHGFVNILYLDFLDFGQWRPVAASGGQWWPVAASGGQWPRHPEAISLPTTEARYGLNMPEDPFIN